MVYTAGVDSLLTCPLDESHRILKSRMQFHLVRCMKNHELRTQMRCPWNPLHIIDKFAYEDHYKRQCEDMPGADVLTYSTDNGKDYDVASVPVNATNLLMPKTEEDWDADPHPVGTYDPAKSAANRMVLRPSVGLSKSQRKQWRQAERRRFQKLEEEGPIEIHPRSSKKFDKTKPLNPTRDIGVALKLDNPSGANSGDAKNTGSKAKNIANNPVVPEIPNPATATQSFKEKNLPSIGNGAHPKTISRGSNISVSRNDEISSIEDVPNLIPSFANGIQDAASKRSNADPRSNIEELRKAFEATVIMSNTDSTPARRCDTDNSDLLDEAACLPNLVSTFSESDEPTVLALSQQLAELTTEQEKIANLKAQLYRKIVQLDLVPNLVSSDVSLASHNSQERQPEDGTSNVITDDDFTTVQQKSSFKIGIPRCAANFSKFSRNGEQRTVGIGRGMVFALDSYKNHRRPGPIDVERENSQIFSKTGESG